MTKAPSIRVCIIQPGLARYRVPVYQELARRPGIDVHVLHSVDPKIPSVRAEGVRTTQTPERIFNIAGHEARWHHAMWQMARRDVCDVLVLPWNTRYLSLVPALLRARQQRVGTVLWGHGYSKHDSQLRSAARVRVTSLADALMFYSSGAAAQFVQSGQSTPRRVHVALNTIDHQTMLAAAAAWQQTPEKLAAFRREHGLEGKRSLLFVSRFDPLNRIDLLIDAAALLRHTMPDLVVNIVGAGDQADQLRAQASRLGLGDVVRFPGAIYEEMQLAPFFLTASAFVYPVNVGLSLLHSFAYGVPVITSSDASRQNPEFEALVPGHNGLVYRDGDVQALADAIASLWHDPGILPRLSAAARRTKLDQFTLERMVDGMEGAIRFAAEQMRG